MSEYTAREHGLPPPAADPIDILGQPRGDAMYPVPHVATFGGEAGWSNRAYLQMHDEAVAHSRENSERIRLDPVVESAMRLLVEPIVLLSHSFQPDDDEDPRQVEAAARTEKRLSHIPGFLFGKRWLVNDGVFVGRTALKTRWQMVQKPDKLYMLPTGFEPVSGDKLVFKWDGSVGVLVRSSFPGPTEAVPGGGGRAYFFTPDERENLIVYNFEPTDVSYWRPQRAGAIKGVGLRDKLYWVWALKAQVWALGMDFMRWFAQGLTVYYFRSGNAEHARSVRAWVEAQAGQNAMLFPYFVGGEREFKPIERFEASTASPQFIQSLITDYFDRIIKELILGQTLTSGTAATGMGSGVAQAHQGTFDQRVKYHATAVDECLTADLLGPYYRANEPGVPPGRWVTDLDDPNAQSMIENASRIVELGGAVPEEPLMEAGGVPLPKPGQTILTNIAPQQPAATGPVPDDVPVAQPQPAAPQGGPPPVQLSRQQFAEVLRLGRKGNRRALALLRSRRWSVAG
jgi:hypothetical protein